MENRTAEDVTLVWTADDRLGAIFYVVQFREINVTDFNTSSPVSVCMYTFMCMPIKHKSFPHLIIHLLIIDPPSFLSSLSFK